MTGTGAARRGRIAVVGEAGTAAQALARIPAVQPDVAILDIRLSDGDGVSFCREIRSAVNPPPACLMLTSYSDDEALFGAIMAGASGYLLKQIAGVDLVAAVRMIASGGSLLGPRATASPTARSAPRCSSQRRP
jgi:DNA-binding NarL/FixJ family response regulator